MFLRHAVAILLLSISMLICIGGLDQDRKDWIDPDDMLNFDPSQNKMIKRPPKDKGSEEQVKEDSTAEQPDENIVPIQNTECHCEHTECPPVQECPGVKDCVCEQASLPLLRNYIKTLLTNFENQTPLGSSSSEYVIRVSLSADQILILNRFVEKGSPTHVHDVHEILTSMIDSVTTSSLGAMEKFALLLEHKIGLSLNRLIQFCMLCALASVVLLIEIRLHIPWRKRVMQLIVLMFVISVPWTWYELYKHAEIEHHSVTNQKIPSECKEDGSDYWRTIVSLVSLQKDKCAEYYEHIMIDPIVKVPPTKAIAVTFVRFFMAPLKDIGTSFSEFLKALLVDLPLTYQPVAIIMVTVFFFLFLFMMFGYSIRLPFFLTIEKTQQTQAISDSRIQEAIGDGNKEIMDQLQALTDRMKSTEIQFNTKIDDLKQVQQMAIEYNMSSSFASESPTLPSALRSQSHSSEEKNRIKGASNASSSRESSQGEVKPSVIMKDSDKVDGKYARGDGKDTITGSNPVIDTVSAESLTGNIDNGH